MAHVLRVRAGDDVVLFDGSGCEFQAVVQAVRRGEVELSIQDRWFIDRELDFALVLAVALPKGDRQEWLVQKAVELGVTALQPWQTERSVALPSEKTVSRLQRTVIEASKQCGRNRLMEIRVPQDYAAVLTQAHGAIRLLAHPDTGVANDRVTGLARPNPGETLWLGIGPEGGFTSVEVELAVEYGWQRLGLGPRILRTETAAVSLAARVVLA